MCGHRYIFSLFVLSVSLAQCLSTSAQTDTTKKLSIDSIILRQKGIIRRLGQNLLTDTIVENNLVLLRTDKPFQRYQGRIIRHIVVQTLKLAYPLQIRQNPMINSNG